MLLVCSCKKSSSTPTTDLLDLHDVDIYPGESVNIAASTPCDWWMDGHTQKVNSTTFTFNSKNKVTRTEEFVVIYARPHNTNTTEETCTIRIKASHTYKFYVESAKYSTKYNKWEASSEDIYIYHDIPDQYYLISPSYAIDNIKAYKITENPKYSSHGTTPDLSYRYMCTVDDETIYLKF